MSPRDQGLWLIYRLPLLIGVLSLIGLVGALLGDGLWDGLGAALLAGGLALATAAWARQRPGTRKT